MGFIKVTLQPDSVGGQNKWSKYHYNSIQWYNIWFSVDVWDYENKHRDNFQLWPQDGAQYLLYWIFKPSCNACPFHVWNISIKHQTPYLKQRRQSVWLHMGYDDIKTDSGSEWADRIEVLIHPHHVMFDIHSETVHGCNCCCNAKIWQYILVSGVIVIRTLNIHSRL